jgi:hypothetical protein
MTKAPGMVMERPQGSTARWVKRNYAPSGGLPPYREPEGDV